MNIRRQDNLQLIERIELLIQENDRIKKQISSLQNLLSTQICLFFELSNSIKQTRKRFCYENVRECYNDLVYFYGCADSVQNADDYKECYKDIFEKEYNDDDGDDNNDDYI